MKLLGFIAWILLATINIAAPRQQVDPAKIKEGDLNKVVITLERSQCFGSCPVYSVTIHGDGTVVYKGKRYVKVSGTRRYKIPKEDVKKLVAEFYRIDYFSLKAEYTERVNDDGTITNVTDLPGTTTSITINGKRKSVYNYFGGPESLEELEHKIDDASRSARFWSKPE
jgi:hypothetical protein